MRDGQFLVASAFRRIMDERPIRARAEAEGSRTVGFERNEVNGAPPALLNVSN